MVLNILNITEKLLQSVKIVFKSIKPFLRLACKNTQTDKNPIISILISNYNLQIVLMILVTTWIFFLYI